MIDEVPQNQATNIVPTGFNWGAFWLTWLWGIGHGIWISILLILLLVVTLLVQLGTAIVSLFTSSPNSESAHTITWVVFGGVLIINLLVSIWFGVKGSNWAWSRRGQRDEATFAQREKTWAVAGWVIGILVILSWIPFISGLTKNTTSNTNSIKCAPGVSIMVGDVEQCGTNGNRLTTTNTPKPVAASSVTTLGYAVVSTGFSVKVTGVKLDPPVIGDAPDAGKQYIEVDVSATNTGAQQASIEGGFAYRPVTDSRILPANTMGTSLSDPNKKVQIVGRTSFFGSFIAPKAATIGSLIFQIPKGDSGQLVWQSSIFDPTSTALAFFALK